MRRRDFLASLAALAAPSIVMPATLSDPLPIGYQRLSRYMGDPLWGMVVQWGELPAAGRVVFPLLFDSVLSVVASARDGCMPDVVVTDVDRSGAWLTSGAQWLALGRCG